MLIAVWAAQACVWAQALPFTRATAKVAETGVIAGHVEGPGGVAVPGATVLVINPETGERKETWTDEAGNYVLAGVKPGSYRLEVSLLGFATNVREPVPVEGDQSKKVDLVLALAVPMQADAARRHPGAGFETGATPNLGSAPPEFREELGERTAQNAAARAEMTGGDQSSPGRGAVASTASVRFESTLAGTQGENSGGAEPDVSADAARSEEANSFLLAGSVSGAHAPEDQEGRGRQGGEEFRRMRQDQTAPGFGGGPGFEGPATFWSRFRRPQANRLRGNVLERYSNSALDARPYPLNVPQSHQIASYQQESSASLGGPLSIPRIYRGEDKTSFFVHYHFERNRTPFDSFSTVPTPAERSGDFSQAVIPAGPLAGTVPILFQPQPGPYGPRTPFADNLIPSSMLNPAAVGLLKFIPPPNLPGSVQNFHLQEALPSTSDRIMGRVGHQLSAKDSVFAFYFFNSARSMAVANFPELTRHISARSQNLNLGETHTFGPSTVNTFTFNFNRQRLSTLNPFAYQQDLAGALGIEGVSQDPRDWGLPLISFTNFTALSDVIPSLTRNQTVRASDFITLNRGKHNVKLGGELRRVQLNTKVDPDARGTFTFTGFATSDFTAPGFPLPSTGFDLADFLLGLPQVTTVRFGASSNYLRSWVYSGFVQDDWRATSQLTFNLGLRYEYFLPFREKYGRLADLAIGPGFSTVGVVTGLDPGSFPDSLIRSDPNNFAPRLGLAFRPWTRHTLVLRAGYGIFYDGSIYQRLTPNLLDQPPFADASTLVTSPREVLTLEQGFPQIGRNLTRNTYAVDPNFLAPYGQTWNFSMEQELARNLILSVGYVGTKGSKLDLLLAPNRIASTPTLRVGRRIPNALQFRYETSGAASIYHGLQVALRRQFAGGFSMNVDYTFSKSIDNAASVGGAGNTVVQNDLDLRAERGLSVFDVRHRLVLNHTYEFPFGERHRYLNHGGALAWVVDDWQWGGNATLESGTPFTARALGNLSNNIGIGAYGSQRADATGAPVDVPGADRSTLRYFNTRAFALPAPGEFGNAGRNTIPGPRAIDFNMALSRFVTVSREKSVRAEFRIEANNIFNTPSFSGLATVVNAVDFGRVTSVKNMRTVALSLRLRF